MDVVYTNKDKQDIGKIRNCQFDLAYGSDENNFELTIAKKEHCVSDDCFVYVFGTEYGGIVDALETDSKQVKYKGRTWHGILASKIIEPTGDYLTINAPVVDAINTILQSVGLSDLFVADTIMTNMISYRVPRYINAYDGIKKMLKKIGAKMTMQYDGEKVRINALPVIRYENDRDTTTSNLSINRIYNGVNHVICLGNGKLSERKVIHLYMDADGNISQTHKTYTGIEEIVEVYDYPNVESDQELIDGGTEILESAFEDNSASLSVKNDAGYDVGDILEAYDDITDTTVVQRVLKKIVSINGKRTNIEYEVGAV